MLKKILLPFFAAFALMAAQSVFDFEKENALKSWSVRTPGQDTIELSSKYVTEGVHGVRYTTPAYKDGMNIWPCVDGVPDVKDWSGYDRMVIDVVNVGASRSSFSVYASDSKTKIALCLLGNFWLSGEYEILRIVLPFSKMEAKIDWTDMSLVHLSSNTASKDTNLYIGGIYLLKPDEEPPVYSSKFLTDVRDHVALMVERMYMELESRGNAFAEETEELRPEFQQLLADARGRYEQMLGLFSSDPSSIPLLGSHLKELTAIRDECIRQFYQKRFDHAARDLGIVVGIVSSMERVMPKDHPFDYSIRRDEKISLARNEWQSFQLAVRGYNCALKHVSVVASDLHSEDGLIFPASRIECQTVGYVQTKNNPPYNPEYIGWWPDPILNFQQSCDIAAEDTQSFWIRVHADKRQQPGVYTGTLTVNADDMEPVVLNLTVKVRDFILPDETPLATAIHTEPPKVAGAGTEKWQAMKYVYADFLGDYHVDFDQLYRWGEPDWDVILYLREQGRLSSFNLGSAFVTGVKDHVGTPGSFERELEKFVNHMRPTYEKARELGLLDYAYIYGFDECKPEEFEYIETVAKRIHDEFPGVKFMTTSFDVSCGEDTIAKSVDSWCPLTNGYILEKVRKAQTNGTWVWWYICCGPLNPFCNWFVEYSPIETRLLMGAMAAKYRPDGFLYYYTDYWNKNTGIDEGPYTTWNPVSYTTYHGDGSLFYCDTNGNPLPSIRLENFRDGVQDFGYVRILEDLIMKVEGDSALAEEKAAWLEEARTALEVPTELVKGLTVFSHDPKVLRQWRDNVGDLIEASGLSHDYRWKHRPAFKK